MSKDWIHYNDIFYVCTIKYTVDDDFSEKKQKNEITMRGTISMPVDVSPEEKYIKIVNQAIVQAKNYGGDCVVLYYHWEIC